MACLVYWIGILTRRRSAARSEDRVGREECVKSAGCSHTKRMASPVLSDNAPPVHAEWVVRPGPFCLFNASCFVKSPTYVACVEGDE